MKKSLLFSAIVAFAMQMSAAIVNPDFNKDGIYYHIDNADAKTVSVIYKIYDEENHTPVSDYTGVVTIPSSVENSGVTYTVNAIYTDAFLDCTGVTAVNLPSTLETIGEEAFKGCTGISSFTLPASLKEIQKSAFSGCEGITTMVIPNGVTTFGTNIFTNCTNLTGVTLPEGVTIIANAMFQGCTAITEFEIPATVTKIDGGAFNGCTGLTKITIGKGVETIGSVVFQGCTGMTEIIVDADNVYYSSYDGCLYTKDFTTLKQVALGKTECTVKEGCTKLDTSCAYGSAIEKLTLPGSVNNFQSSCLMECSDLKEIFFPYTGTTVPTSSGLKLPISVNTPKVKLYVPADKISLFNISKWTKAVEILDIATSAELTPEAAAVKVKAIYNVNGSKASANAKGIVLIQTDDNRVVKVAK